MYLPAFDMNNFNNGIGQEEDQDTDPISPLSWRTGGQEERCNQYPNAERLNFPLGNDQPALEYAQSLNALNAAFGGYVQPPAFMGSSPAHDGQSYSNQAFAASTSGVAFAASREHAHQGTSDGFLYQWQQPTASAATVLEQPPLEQHLSIPQRRASDATAETHDSQGHVQGMFGSKKAKTLLPIDFKPSNNSVILGRGRCAESIGNRRFKAVVQDHLQEYLEAPGKLEKTFIVSKVLNIIEQSCPVGAFVKYENGRWWSAGERASREKIGASFRDALHTLYKSSSKSKVAKRKAKAEAEKKHAPK